MEESKLRLSTNLTLFFKFFIPVFWIFFFFAFTIAVWTTNVAVGPLAFLSFKIGLTVFWIVGALGLGVSLMRLKRVDVTERFFYVTNYFKTGRYPWTALRQLRKIRLPFFWLVFFDLHNPGTFGRRFFFLGSTRNWKTFEEQFLKEEEEQDERTSALDNS